MSEAQDLQRSMLDVVSELTGQVVSRFVAVVEVLEEDGTRALITINSEDSTMWDAIGMLTFASRTLGLGDDGYDEGDDD